MNPKQKAVKELNNLIDYALNLIENDKTRDAEILGNMAVNIKVMYIDQPEPYWAVKAAHNDLLRHIDRYNYFKKLK